MYTTIDYLTKEHGWGFHLTHAHIAATQMITVLETIQQTASITMRILVVTIEHLTCTTIK